MAAMTIATFVMAAKTGAPFLASLAVVLLVLLTLLIVLVLVKTVQAVRARKICVERKH
jgi:tellurite resistance protein